MAAIKNFINSRQVLIYFILTFAFSWCGFLLVLGPDSFPGNQEKFETIFPLAILLMLAGPCIVSILLTGLICGRRGYRELFSKLLKWRVKFRWYTIALLPAPILAAVLLFMLSQKSPIFIENDKIIVLLSGVAAGFTTILEELGWTGFAVPRLRLRYGIFTTGLIVGILWAAWHLLQILWMGGVYVGELSLMLFLPLYFFSSIGLVAYRVLLVWVFDCTGSLLVTTLMHASLSASTVIIFRPLETGINFLTFQWLFAIGLWIIIAAVVLTNKEHLLRKPIIT